VPGVSPQCFDVVRIKAVISVAQFAEVYPSKATLVVPPESPGGPLWRFVHTLYRAQTCSSSGMQTRVAISVDTNSAPTRIRCNLGLTSSRSPLSISILAEIQNKVDLQFRPHRIVEAEADLINASIHSATYLDTAVAWRRRVEHIESASRA
jgi:hypothetical protein